MKEILPLKVCTEDPEQNFYEYRLGSQPILARRLAKGIEVTVLTHPERRLLSVGMLPLAASSPSRGVARTLDWALGPTAQKRLRQIHAIGTLVAQTRMQPGRVCLHTGYFFPSPNTPEALRAQAIDFPNFLALAEGIYRLDATRLTPVKHLDVRPVSPLHIESLVSCLDGWFPSKNVSINP